MSKLFSGLTGIEVYQIPDMVGHEIVHIELEKLEDILSGDYGSSYQMPNAIYFNTKGFVDALDAGDLSAVTSLFIDDKFILHWSLESNTLREKRELMVNTKFADRALMEATKIFDASNVDIINTINSVEEELLWKEKAKKKFYTLCLLDSSVKVIQNKTIPGDIKDLYLYADLNLMDRDILELFKELSDLKKSLPEIIDKRTAFRILRVEYFTDLKMT